VLAGLVGRSESWLSQVERGKRGIDSHAVLTRLAAVLRVDVEEITGPAGDGNGEGRRVYEPAEAIERAMMRYDAARAFTGVHAVQAPGSTAHLLGMARSAYRDYQATRYEDAGRLLPALITEAGNAAHAGSEEGLSARAIVYDTAAALLIRVGKPALAWAASDRAMNAAALSGRPVLAAVAAWRLSYVITGRRHPQEGLDLAMTAATAMEPVMRSPSPEMLSVYGALHLAAATAAAAVYDRVTASALLDKARGIAGQTGNGNHMGTAFGPVNVAIHAIATALQFGDAKTAAETGEALELSALPAGCTGRRAQLHLNLARAYSMRKQDAAAVNLLLTAERISPQLVRYDTRTHDVLAALLRREHQPSTPELRPLARRAGVI
jgi:transcriptional regulator with XRE-family HTH domain